MAQYGFTLYCEGNDPLALVAQAIAAEEAGFDFLVISDHYHPWLPNQTHAGFAWSILGAVAQATKRIRLATMVTCPIMRYHPAIIAQAAATTAVLSNNRFTLGVGAGERLNEHIIGLGWPSVAVRHQMLREAVEIIQKLWQGGYQSYRGEYFYLDDARVFDLPQEKPSIFMAASGVASAKLAALSRVGLCVTEPLPEVVKTFVLQGGNKNQTWGQVVLGWGATETDGIEAAYEQFRFTAGGWKVQSELPNPANFAAATRTVRPQDLAETIPAGPDVKKHVAAIKKFSSCGIQHIAIAYPGKNTDGFMRFWQESLRPALDHTS